MIRGMLKGTPLRTDIASIVSCPTLSYPIHTTTVASVVVLPRCRSTYTLLRAIPSQTSDDVADFSRAGKISPSYRPPRYPDVTRTEPIPLWFAPCFAGGRRAVCGVAVHEARALQARRAAGVRAHGVRPRLRLQPFPRTGTVLLIDCIIRRRSIRLCIV